MEPPIDLHPKGANLPKASDKLALKGVQDGVVVRAWPSAPRLCRPPPSRLTASCACSVPLRLWCVHPPDRTDTSGHSLFRSASQFCTYSLLISGGAGAGNQGNKKKKLEPADLIKPGTRLKQLMDWLHADGGGMIVLDECHKVRAALGALEAAFVLTAAASPMLCSGPCRLEQTWCSPRVDSACPHPV